MSIESNFGYLKTATTLTRPNDSNAYTSGDLVANNTTAGSVTPLSFTLGRAGSPFGVTGARISKSGTSVTNASFRIHLYSASPTPANGDNGAWSTDKAASYLGSVDVTVDKAFTDGATGVATATEIVLGNTITTIYALLEARGAYTPGAQETFSVSIFGKQY